MRVHVTPDEERYLIEEGEPLEVTIRGVSTVLKPGEKVVIHPAPPPVGIRRGRRDGLTERHLGEVRDHDIGARCEELFRLPAAVHADDEPEVPRSAGTHACLGVLHDHRSRGVDAQPLCGFQEHGW